MSDHPSLPNSDGSDYMEDSITKVSGMYESWFLDYASYVILERAVPDSYDGLKPVQRRILHAMKELDDGRYNKVANVVGHTMRYHPHGDASITDALVQLGQKDLLIDTQGNWGNLLTGDRAAAARYIEARLSKFALDVAYNPKITHWQASYDGRNREPIHLPMKFPLLLAQGVEGIAVGLSTKIMPHNFNELIDASIENLRGNKPRIYPDFQTGGIADFSDYQDGLRGGKIKVRARIHKLDKNTLEITEIPFGSTTSSLIDSILKANDKGKIKIRKIEDNTAASVEIIVYLAGGLSPDKLIDALYAFTDCETTISPLCCVIQDEKPHFSGVSELLYGSTMNTKALLRRELQVRLDELQEQWHFASLERIFIAERIYRDMERQTSWEGVIRAIEQGLQPHIGQLLRPLTQEDILRLTEIRIKKISRFDIEKAKRHIDNLEAQIAQVKGHLDGLVDYAIGYFKKLKRDYGAQRERKTEIRRFEDISKQKVALANVKCYANFKDGFIGTSLRKDTYLFDASDIADLIVLLESGKMLVTRISAKTFVGKNIRYVGLFKKNDTRTVYNLIYRDGKTGPTYWKRFAVNAVTRDREYDLTAGTKGSEILYLKANPNGEAEVVTVHLKALQRVKKLRFDLDFASLAIKGRGAKGNLVTKNPVKRIALKEAGVSTLTPRKLWFDPAVCRLNTEGRGRLLGAFQGADKLLLIDQNGLARILNLDLSTHFDEHVIKLEKWNPQKPVTAVYYNGHKGYYYVKRFRLECTSHPQSFIPEGDKTFLEWVSTDYRPRLQVVFAQRGKAPECVDLSAFIAVKGIKAIGKRLTTEKIEQLSPQEPLPYVEEHEVESPEPPADTPLRETESEAGEQVTLTFEKP